jgi:NAD(P)H-hydrate repair Nnr-like enzyme with NAD(P)H-hydrate dehydratase domain
MQNYWQKQAKDKPLFPDMLWSRPENKNLAGKLLIIGGNAFGFAAAGEAYAEAIKAGIGTARVLLPNSLRKTVGKMLEAGEYAPSTKSGSFAQTALEEFLAMSNWADATLLAGDFGRNSETAILLEKFATKYSGSLTITQDAVDYFNKSGQILQRENSLLVLSFAQLQKLAVSARFPTAFTYEMDFLHLIEALHQLTQIFPASVIVKRDNTIFVAVTGQVSTTQVSEDEKVWRVKTATHATVWWLQNPTKSFEAFTTALS